MINQFDDNDDDIQYKLKEIEDKINANHYNVNINEED